MILSAARACSPLLIAVLLIGTVSTPACACMTGNLWRLDGVETEQVTRVGYESLFAGLFIFSVCFVWMQTKVFKNHRKGWITIGKKRSKSHRFYGFGGWNYVIVFGLLLGSFFQWILSENLGIDLGIGGIKG